MNALKIALHDTNLREGIPPAPRYESGGARGAGRQCEVPGHPNPMWEVWYSIFLFTFAGLHGRLRISEHKSLMLLGMPSHQWRYIFVEFVFIFSHHADFPCVG